MGSDLLVGESQYMQTGSAWVITWDWDERWSGGITRTGILEHICAPCIQER